jgi:Na+-transporting NADH:ubiquinone oxidoreductase subunit NqrB
MFALNLNDRFTRGFLAGVLGGIVMSILDLISFALGIVELLYLDWAAVLTYGYRPNTILETVVAQAGQLFFSGIMGIIFAYLITVVGSVNYLFKGCIYGLAIFFGSYAITLLFKVSPLIPIHVDTVLSNIVTSLVYGVVLAQSLHWLEKKAAVK